MGSDDIFKKDDQVRRKIIREGQALEILEKDY